MLSPRKRRYLEKILPFGLIWLIVGWVLLFVEAAATGNQNLQPDTVITLTLPVFIFASIAVFLVGLMIGLFEYVFFNNLFEQEKFVVRVFAKLIVYGLAMVVIISISFPLAAALESNISIINPQVWQKFGNFINSIAFLSTLLQMGVSLFLCFFYAGISENLGHGMLANFFLGKYTKPVKETRIFMFLDMRKSTTTAEKLGSKVYFELLKDYYADLADAIIDYEGEVYQYIGDEIVVTWELNDGIKNNNCLKCFYAMKQALRSKEEYYQNTYDLSPQFKAGLHSGEVTTGEIGALKKEIFFTGDVLNVTSRIQNLCNEYKSELLVSCDLVKTLKLGNDYSAYSLGAVSLKGRLEPIELYAINQLSL